MFIVFKLLEPISDFLGHERYKHAPAEMSAENWEK